MLSYKILRNTQPLTAEPGRIDHYENWREKADDFKIHCCTRLSIGMILRLINTKSQL